MATVRDIGAEVASWGMLNGIAPAQGASKIGNLEMNGSVRATSIAVVVLVSALLACGGKAAVEDLEKLKEKTCSCKGNATCVEEAKQQAAEWVKKHKNATGGDQEKAEKLINDIMKCELSVALEVAKAAEG